MYNIGNFVERVDRQFYTNIVGSDNLADAGPDWQKFGRPRGMRHSEL